MFLLDTNIVSEFRKAEAGRADEGVLEWGKKIPAALMFLSVISLHELEHGVLMAERSDPRKGKILRKWLESGVKNAFADRIIDVDPKIAIQAATFHVPDPAPFRDALIGATALVSNMVMVTRDYGDFSRFAGLEVLNPWN